MPQRTYVIDPDPAFYAAGTSSGDAQPGSNPSCRAFTKTEVALTCWQLE